jgi:glycosyltransferase 2 family protein
MNSSTDKRGTKLLRIPVWLRLVFCVVILIAVYSRVDKDQLKEAWRNIDVIKVLIPLAFFWLYHLNSALRWFVLLRCVDGNVRLKQLVRIYFMSLFAGMFMPGTVGVEIARLVAVTQAKVNPTRAIISTALERLLGLIALAVAVCVGMAVAPQYVHAPIAAAAWIICLAIVFVVAVLSNRKCMGLCMSLLPEGVQQRASRPLITLRECMEAYRAQRSAVAVALFLSLVAQMLRIARVATAVAALGIAIPLAVLFVAVPVVTLAAMIPITFGGLGIREAGYVYFLGQAGGSAADAVVLALVLYLLAVVSVLPGGALLLVHRKRSVLPQTKSEQGNQPATPQCVSFTDA